MLFDARVHEPLLDMAWSDAAVEGQIRAIASEAEEALRREAWWAVHPLDAEPGDPDTFHGIYLGAAGVLWALDRLARAGLHEPRLDHGQFAAEVSPSHLRRPQLDGAPPSLWMGEGGIELVAWLLAPSPERADRLAAIVAAEPQEETLELMWGSPGLLVIADVMSQRTGEPRWATAWNTIAERLLARRGERVPGLWTQRLCGSTKEILGPAHGFAGIVSALARRPDLLGAEQLVPQATQTLAATAVREGDRANWPPVPSEALPGKDRAVRTQWCHGAPGMVTSLAGLPPEAELDALLLAGGELTWAAGPLRKGAGLCHGTAGNGFALLKLFARTGDEAWLQRARRFATHAAAQVEAARRQHGQGRHTLWTGDLGTAMFLQACLAGPAELPALDAW